MLVCEVCGGKVEFAVTTGGWYHTDNPRPDHATKPSSKVETTTLMRDTPYIDTLDNKCPCVLSTRRYEQVHEALRHYYYVEGVDWTVVRDHDQGRMCHCVTCKRECPVCIRRG